MYSNNQCTLRINRRLSKSFDIPYIVDIRITREKLTFISHQDFSTIFKNRQIPVTCTSDYPQSAVNKYIIYFNQLPPDFDFEIFY